MCGWTWARRCDGFMYRWQCLSPGVVSSLFSYAAKMASGRMGPSLGAVSSAASAQWCHRDSSGGGACDVLLSASSVGRHHGRAGRRLHQDAWSQTGHHLPAHVHLHRRQRESVHTCVSHSCFLSPLMRHTHTHTPLSTTYVLSKILTNINLLVSSKHTQLKPSQHFETRNLLYNEKHTLPVYPFYYCIDLFINGWTI